MGPSGTGDWSELGTCRTGAVATGTGGAAAVCGWGRCDRLWPGWGRGRRCRCGLRQGWFRRRCGCGFGYGGRGRAGLRSGRGCSFGGGGTGGGVGFGVLAAAGASGWRSGCFRSGGSRRCFKGGPVCSGICCFGDGSVHYRMRCVLAGGGGGSMTGTISTPSSLSSFAAKLFSVLRTPRKRCSVPMCLSPRRSASSVA